MSLGVDISEKRIIEVCSALNIHNRILDLSYNDFTKEIHICQIAQNE